MKSVYLAGPIAGLTVEQAVTWRAEAAFKLWQRGIQALSPMRAKAELFPQGHVFDNQGHDRSPLTTGKGIVTRDRNDIVTCDLMLVNLTGVNKFSLGTAVEFGWADAYRKPIITIMPDWTGGETTNPNNPFHHAFIIELSGYIVNSLDDGLALAIQVLG